MAESAQYQDLIAGSTAREIAATAEAAIREGRLGAGDALPTVRALAGAMRVSPATVASGYRILQQRGLVVSAGRRGTQVAPRPALRTATLPAGADTAGSRTALRDLSQSAAGAGPRDLSQGLPDPALLPPLGPALARVDLDRKLRIGERASIDEELLALAAQSMREDGIAADAITVLSGALDAVERVLEAHLRAGDRVVIEDPAYPPLRDLLLALGLRAVAVPVDDRGLLPDAFDAALASGAEAAVIVPRAQNPLGAALDEQRASELRQALAAHPQLLLIEDDHAASIAGATYASLTSAGCSRWAVIRSTSKALHPDLRVALVAGDDTTIARVEGRHVLGPGSVSRILQATAAELLRDPEVESIVARARDTYRARREAMIGALAAHGIAGYGRSGLNVWVPVSEEAPVLRSLLDGGWVVRAGERFRIASPPAIRITIATLAVGEAEQIARAIAAVEHGGRPRRAY